MPQFKIELNPGIDTLATQTLNSAGWSLSSAIRWKGGYLEKIGGWIAASLTAVTGLCRALHGFSDLNNNNYIAVGTHRRLQLLNAGMIYDITPVRKTSSSLSNAFSTSNGTPTVTIDDTGHGASVGDWVNVVIPVAISNLLIFGFYPVASVTDANHYTITANINATSTVAGGGAVPAFTTTNSSNSVSVALANHGLVAQGLFVVQVSTSVGGLTISGSYIVNSVTDSGHFTILAATNATSTATASENSGNAEVIYLLPSGLPSSMFSSGWGGGTWGTGAWGGPSASPALNRLRIWSLDNFGQNLVAVPSGGTLYQWVPSNGLSSPATVVSTAPEFATGMFVAMPQQQVILYGAETGGAQDPLLVRWCDVGDYTTWTATATNQAGSFRLSNASRIVGGTQAANLGLLWTDRDLWAMSYIQPPLIYSFTQIARECGLMANKSYARIAGSVYWLSTHGFFSLGGETGGVQQLPCPVWDIMFNNLDTLNSDKAFAASNTEFGEAMFFFPSKSGGTGEIDSYLKVNVNLNLWDYGSLVRLAWVDGNPLGSPVAADSAGNLWQHEQGYDAGSGNAMTGVFAETGYADLAQGTQFLFVDQIIPDVFMTGASPSVTLTVYTQDYPGGPVTTFGPFTVTPSTQYITLRARARQMAFRIESDSLGTFWRLGAIRYRGAPSGRR